MQGIREELESKGSLGSLESAMSKGIWYRRVTGEHDSYESDLFMERGPKVRRDVSEGSK